MHVRTCMQVLTTHTNGTSHCIVHKKWKEDKNCRMTEEYVTICFHSCRPEKCWCNVVKQAITIHNLVV